MGKAEQADQPLGNSASLDRGKRTIRWRGLRAFSKFEPAQPTLPPLILTLDPEVRLLGEEARRAGRIVVGKNISLACAGLGRNNYFFRARNIKDLSGMRQRTSVPQPR
ncbi:MAG: hypothetical protein AABY91_01000 [Gemmatimonadota bacterium]